MNMGLAGDSFLHSLGSVIQLWFPGVSALHVMCSSQDYVMWIHHLHWEQQRPGELSVSLQKPRDKKKKISYLQSVECLRKIKFESVLNIHSIHKKVKVPFKGLINTISF